MEWQNILLMGTLSAWHLILFAFPVIAAVDVEVGEDAKLIELKHPPNRSVLPVRHRPPYHRQTRAEGADVVSIQVPGRGGGGHFGGGGHHAGVRVLNPGELE